MAKYYILSGDRYLLSNELVDALLSGRFPVNSANYKSVINLLSFEVKMEEKINIISFAVDLWIIKDFFFDHISIELRKLYNSLYWYL